MALLQCKNFLSQTIPHITQKDDIDYRFRWAQRISDQRILGEAAIASEIAAGNLWLGDFWQRDIQTVKDNYTRFYYFFKKNENGKRLRFPNKASFKISIKNQAGGLSKFIGPCYMKKGLDLSKNPIDSSD